jgi:hypothetical protein
MEKMSDMIPTQFIYEALMRAKRERWDIIEEFLKESPTNLKIAYVMKDEEALKSLLKRAKDKRVIKAINGQLNNLKEIRKIDEKKTKEK